MLENKIVITTSWDDGHPLDFKIADLLEKYNINGTFYVPLCNDENTVMNDNQLFGLASRFEIGGHTVNHKFLNTLSYDNADFEISNCKEILEFKLSKKINAFCYPGGKYSLRDIDLVKKAGFLFGRTTNMLHSSVELNHQLLNTSVQVYNHSSLVLTGHCLKQKHFLPILQYCFFLKENKSFFKLAENMMKSILTNGGVFHLWGHSWEIEHYSLWEELELVLNFLAFNPKIKYLNNTECWNDFYLENTVGSLENCDLLKIGI